MEEARAVVRSREREEQRKKKKKKKKHGIPHGGAEGTEERVLTLRELKLVIGIDESASVVVGCGMISLMVQQKAPRSVS